jgi:hypothetical protein
MISAAIIVMRIGPANGQTKQEYQRDAWVTGY